MEDQILLLITFACRLNFSAFKEQNQEIDHIKNITIHLIKGPCSIKILHA